MQPLKSMQFTLTLASLCALSACGMFEKEVKKPAKPIPTIKSVQAEQFVEYLAFAQLAMEGADSTAPAKNEIKQLNAIGKGSKTPKTLGITIITMEYDVDGKSQKLVVPVNSGKTKFASLQKIEKRFTPKKLRNISVSASSISLPPPFKFSDDNVATLSDQIAAEREKLISYGDPLSAYENAKLQLQLTRFFMANNQRDAAYLAMENVKNSLAFVAEKNPDKDIASLSQESVQLEDRLHKEMPYKL